jgi:hypothetical protein
LFGLLVEALKAAAAIPTVESNRTVTAHADNAIGRVRGMR